MKFEHIAEFKKDDEVPSWLLDVEPDEPSTAKPIVRFTQDCHVVELSSGYFVVPDSGTFEEGVIRFENDSAESLLAASSRTVFFPVMFYTMSGPDDDRGPSEELPVSPSGLVGA